MANKRGYGSRQSAGVSAGDYRGYKRAIEQRRKSMNADHDDYEDKTYAEENDDIMAAAEDAYAQSTGRNDEDLDAVYDPKSVQPDSEDEEAMPAPRRRARAYRSGQMSESYTQKDEEAQAEPMQAASAEESAEQYAESQNVGDEDAHDDELADYTAEESSYSDAVYEPYDPDEEEGDYEPEPASVTEWSDGIKRALAKGKAGWMALKAKANEGGKKRPSQKKKRPVKHKTAVVKPQAQKDIELEDYTGEEEQRVSVQPVVHELKVQKADVRTRTDRSEYETVSAELHADEEIKPISRRERRMMQKQEPAVTDEFPNVNIVSRKAIRAQQEEEKAASAKLPEAENQQPAPQPEEAAASEEPIEAAVEVKNDTQPQESVQSVQPEDNSNEEEPDVPSDENVTEQLEQSEPQQTEQDDNGGVMFGVAGRTHVMQSSSNFEFDDSGDEPMQSDTYVETEQTVEVPAQPAYDDSDDDDELESERERSSKKRAHRERKHAKSKRVPVSTEDDDDDYRTDEGDVDNTAKYKRSVNVQPTRMSDDDDEPEDDYVRDDSDKDYGGFIAPDNDFAEDTYNRDENGEYEEDEEDDVPADGKGGGCLKAFTILLVILLVLFGSIWALDYFSVINVRGIASNILSMSIFDPLRGSILPAAQIEDDAVSVTSVPDELPTREPDAVATIQPASTDSVIQTQGSSDQSEEAEATAIPTQTVQLPESTSTLLNIDSPETYSQANALRNELSHAKTSITQLLSLKAEPIEGAEPDNSAFDLNYSVYVNYKRDTDYSREDPITFGLGEDYTDVEGVITFRGNNFRENAAYGTASLEKKKFKILWENKIGSIDSGYAVWTGVGWNGQAVMVHWSDELREMMNIRDEFKYDSDLVEVIYGTLDGNIYFLDSRTGKYTRDPIKLGFPIKGSVSIDPRGYPLLYVGQGISKANGKTGSIGWRVYNLLNQEHMYLLNGHDELRYRTHGSFDGVCLLDAETDTIIEGAENGLFYTIKLNTVFDESVPSITIDPEVTVYRYKSKISRAVGDDGLGIENSVAAYGQYAYFADNSGLLTCLNLNTMEPVWLFNVGDDTDASISLEQQDDGMVALYTINEVDIQGSSGMTTIRKLNALTGEELWNFSVKCKSDGTNGGGGFASPAMGKGELSDLIFFNVCRTEGGGTLYAFNKETGEIVWQKSTNRYSWSSPVLVYSDDGDAVLIVGNSAGKLRMYNPLNGEIYDEIELDGNMEGSPAVYGNTLVIGTRDCRIYGVEIQ